MPHQSIPCRRMEPAQWMFQPAFAGQEKWLICWKRTPSLRPTGVCKSIIYEAFFTFLMHASSKQPSHPYFTALLPNSCTLHLAIPFFLPDPYSYRKLAPPLGGKLILLLGILCLPQTLCLLGVTTRMQNRKKGGGEGRKRKKASMRIIGHSQVYNRPENTGFYYYKSPFNSGS